MESVIISLTSFTVMTQFSDCGSVASQALVIAEAFIGLFMMMYLSVSFARRILR